MIGDYAPRRANPRGIQGSMPRPRRGGREPDVNRVTKAELYWKEEMSVPPPS